MVGCPGIDFVERCPRGLVPKLDPGNEGFLELFLRLLPGLFDGYGAARYEAIDYIMRHYGIQKPMRPIFHDKCLVMIQAVGEIREEKRRDHGQGH